MMYMYSGTLVLSLFSLKVHNKNKSIHNNNINFAPPKGKIHHLTISI